MASGAITTGGARVSVSRSQDCPIEGVHGDLSGDTEQEDPISERSAAEAEGCFDQLVHEYFASPDYKRLAPATQQSYRNVIMRFLREEDVGHRLVREMTRQHVQAIVARVRIGPVQQTTS